MEQIHKVKAWWLGGFPMLAVEVLLLALGGVLIREAVVREDFAFHSSLLTFPSFL